MNIQPIDQENLNDALNFLNTHEDQSQYLIMNLTEHGFTLSEQTNSANYKIIVDNDEIVGVFGLSRRCTLHVQQSTSLSTEILDEIKDEPIAIKSFIGEWQSVQPVYEAYKKQNPQYAPSFFSKEILYRYELQERDTTLVPDDRARPLTSNDFDLWRPLSQAYATELSLPQQPDTDARSSFLKRANSRMIWGLFENNELVTIAGLNAKTQRLGQVGGVFTTPEHRRLGLSKACMQHMLNDCLHTHNHKKSILFTGEDDIAAQKLYESIGYERIGHFALIIG